MKKLIGALMVVLALVCFTSMAFAASKPAKPGQDAKKAAPPAVAQCAVQMIGEVVSVDKATNEVVIKDQKDNAEKTIVVKPADLKKLKLKKGDLIEVGLSEGSNKAEAINLLKAEKQGKK